MDTVADPRANVTALDDILLDHILRTPLANIPIESVSGLVQRIVRRHERDQEAVDVARFGSAI